MSTRQRVIRAAVWTVIILALMVVWGYAAACDMPGSCP